MTDTYVATTISPACDDLIEVDGQINEEFSDPDFAESAYVYTSAGHVIRFRLEAEGWRAAIVCDPKQGEQSTLTISRTPMASSHEYSDEDVDDADDYAHIVCPLRWVVATTVGPAKSGGAR